MIDEIDRTPARHGGRRNKLRGMALRRLAPVLVLVVLTAGSHAAIAQAETASEIPIERLFTHVGDFPLGPATSRVDYQSVDPTAHRLYVAKMGAGQLLAIDIQTDGLVAALDGFPKTTGVLVVPALRKLYASVPGAGLVPSVAVALGMVGLSSGRGAIAVIDTQTLKPIAKIPGGVFPDGIAYDPLDRKIFVSDELGSAILVVDADRNRLVARIAAGGEVGNVQYDPITAKIYTPIQSHNELATIDPATLKLVTRRPLPSCAHPHGLAIVPGAAVGYIACDHNDRLLAVDLAAGKVLDREPVAHDPDVLAIDSGARRLYVAAESGRLSTFDIAAIRAPHVLGDVFVGRGAHSIAVDPESHRLYLPLADMNGRAVMRVLAPKQD